MVVFIASVLGGGSQQMGTFLGYMIFGQKIGSNVNELQMDFFLSITTGFLFFIGLLMFQAAIGFSDTHYHHQGEGNKKMKLNHSSGATYLKWCCTNILLILASQAFK